MPRIKPLDKLASKARRLRVIVAQRDGQVLGFVTTIRDGETAVGYYIGFDRETNATAPIYFRLLQAVVDHAIQIGCSRLSYEPPERNPFK